MFRAVVKLERHYPARNGIGESVMTGEFARNVDYSPAEAVDENKFSVRALVHAEIFVFFDHGESSVFGVEFKLV